ncbi:MAG: hypothetical protein JNM17_32610 [Archangium sp.]|nr:hypothetical protein [Archangium sp.]
MAESFSEFLSAVSTAVGAVAARALKPVPRVSQHWESVEQLAWFGAAADHHLTHVSWSFGKLKSRGARDGKRDTVGVFSITRATFPEVDDEALRLQLEALVPSFTDGATRVFLQRVTAQIAAADALLELQRRLGCEVSLFARTDAVDTPAAPPRWPEHARERVTVALAAMDATLRDRCEQLFESTESELLEAIKARR